MSAKVLLVGEESPLMERIAARVSERDLEARISGDPRDALAVAAQLEVDVVVLNLKDLMEDGVNFLRSLKKSFPAVEVITLSVPSSMRYSIKGMKLGVFSDLVMPFDLDDLLQKIGEALDHKARRARPWLRRLEDLAAGVSFAEAGDFDTAADLAGKRKDQGFDKEE